MISAATSSSQQSASIEFNPKLALKRKERDIAKLLMSDYKIIQNKPGAKFHELTLQFEGPKNTPYEKGSWEIYVLIPEQYPYKSPSIGFINKIFHPNIDFDSGSVCLDVINQTWSPMYELINVFDIFLPQLLTYPNPKDPLNPEAAMIYIKDESVFNEVVSDFVIKYAPKKPVLLKTSSTQDQSNNSKQKSEQLPNPDSLMRSQSQSVSSTSATQSSTNGLTLVSSTRERTQSVQNRGTSTSIPSVQSANLNLNFSKQNSISKTEQEILSEGKISTNISSTKDQSSTEQPYSQDIMKDEDSEEEEEILSEQYLSEISQTSCSELSQTEIDKECAQEY